ncbi:MAG: hypothetical protein M9939_03300 [Mesorhizobium sp.]|nr:hypothetical protein [Mesorhizobium sp.]MCO5160136.1 hypothetical protein [Mesorhizobium sp.]
MTTPGIVLVAAPDGVFRRSLQFALESAGFATDGSPRAAGAFASKAAGQSVCAVIDERAVDDWRHVGDSFRRYGRPVVLVADRVDGKTVLPNVTVVLKPFLGEPLIEAVKNAITSAH